MAEHICILTEMRLPFFCIFFIGLISGFSHVSAQTIAEGDADLRRQVAALREAVIQQTRQIDSLTAEIERLGIALGQRRPANTAASVTTVPTSGAAPSVNTPPPPVAAVVSTPSPSPDPNILQHTVIKGDNLTNLAKKHGTTVELIQKLNKITDARKMQVGQILAIPAPTPTASPVPSPTSN